MRRRERRNDGADDAVIDVKVVPGSSCDQVAGMLGEAVKIKVAAPPQDGKANEAVCRLVAQVLGVGKRDVTIASGHGQASKRLAIRGMDAAEVRAKLAAAAKR